jgi:hypothetical protein
VGALDPFASRRERPLPDNPRTTFTQSDTISAPASIPQGGLQVTPALRWSYDLLEPPDRELFSQLAVFAGPARLEAIAHVAECVDVEALDGLTRLIDAGLVRLQSGPDPRYWMLEPVRQFTAVEVRATKCPDSRDARSNRGRRGGRRPRPGRTAAGGELTQLVLRHAGKERPLHIPQPG